MNRPMRIIAALLLLFAVILWFGPLDLFLGWGPVAALLLFSIAISALVVGFLGLGKRATAAALFLIAIGLCIFAYWGTSATAGRAQFDEMAGMIPFLAGVAGIGLAIVALVVAVVPGRDIKT